MRFNEKLNGIFELPRSQTEFKRLADECKEISSEKSKNDEYELPKPKILGRIMGVMDTLAIYGIDISDININTRWKDIENKIPEEERESIKTNIYLSTGMRIDDDYKLGLYINSARNAFWHRENENSKFKNGIKKLYNESTDRFFENYSFESLYKMGFFNDIKEEGEEGLVNDEGFIIGHCANLDNNYGYNVRTGTKYTKDITVSGYIIPGTDIRGFARNGIHKDTGIRYDTRFFRFDKELNTWINLHTGKDEDLLGYNHDGIMVNGKKGRLGFDRDGLWHKALPDGSYSKEGQEFDETGVDCYGFKKGQSSQEPINGFYKVYPRDGSKKPVYLFQGENGRYFNYDGYDIAGFDKQGFNKDGINHSTGIEYDSVGRRIFNKRDKKPSVFDLVDAVKKRDQTRLIEFIVLSKQNPNIENENWFHIAKSRFGDVRKRVHDACDEMKISDELMINSMVQSIDEIDAKMARELEKRRKIEEAKGKVIKNIKRFLAILKGDVSQIHDEEGGR